MSATAKMMADSTQEDLPDRPKKRKKSEQKKKVKKKKDSDKKAKKSKPVVEDYDEYDLDLENDVHELGAFVADRDSLLQEMLHCVKGPSLQRALPDILKEVPLEEVKRRCMDHLEVMSKKRIRRIIDGDDPATISSSGTEDESTDDEHNTPGMQEESEDEEAQVADSTSLYTDGLDASDRDVEEPEEGSMGRASYVYTPDLTEDEAPALDQEESQDMDYEENEEVTAEDTAEDEDTQTGPKAHLGDPEEGEVRDDDDDDDDDYDGDEELEEGEIGRRKRTGPIESNVDGKCAVEAESATVEQPVAGKEDGSETIEGTMHISEAQETSEQKCDEKIQDAEVDVADKGAVTPCPEDASEMKEDADDKEQMTGTSVEPNTAANRRVVISEQSLINVKSDEDVVNVEEKKAVPDDCEKEGNSNEDMNDDDAPTDLPVSDEDGEEVRQERKSGGRIVIPPAAEAIAPVLTRNQMELLELEMRARAIKAMLKNAKS